MKRILVVVSLALMVAACSSTRGKLLSIVEYHDGGTVFQREEYHYSGDELVLSTRVTYFNDAPDSSWTEYEIRRNGQTTDTIETINSSSTFEARRFAASSRLPVRLPSRNGRNVVFFVPWF